MVLVISNSMQFIITFVSALLLSYIHDTQAQGNLIFNQFPCSNSENYTSSSQFGKNLNFLLSSLVSNGSRNGFFNTSIGSEPNVAYGLVQCRSDLSMQNCETCLKAASVEIIQTCPNRKDATLQYDQCILRYSNNPFFSEFDIDLRSEYNPATASDPDQFNHQLASLMDNLSQTAAARLSRYDAGSTNYTAFSKIYGVVQCTRDLLPTGCLFCLRSMIKEIPSCCNASLGAKVFSRTCYLRYEMNPFVVISAESSSPPVESPPPLVKASPPQATGIENGSSRDVSLVVIPIIVVVLVLAICIYFIYWWRKSKKIGERDRIIKEKFLHMNYNTIKAATDSFSVSNKLGEGGFGAVYKGRLPNANGKDIGKDIAVKKLSKNSAQGEQEFKNEVLALHTLQHRNLVTLLGFSLSGDEKLLIYEYVSNGSLDNHIFGWIEKPSLDWETRYKIIKGIAGGLVYLHEDSKLKIIHLDLKSGNILLDEDNNAKIADFGTAKLFGVDQTRRKTSRIIGTLGYMAPEYASEGLITEKSDVYSFGVLLLEIISGKRINDPSQNLLLYAWRLWNDNNALKLTDRTLGDSFSGPEVIKCIHIALLCVQEKSNDRPSMSSINLMLKSESATRKIPLAPAFTTDKTEYSDASAKTLLPINNTSSFKLR